MFHLCCSRMVDRGANSSRIRSSCLSFFPPAVSVLLQIENLPMMILFLPPKEETKISGSLLWWYHSIIGKPKSKANRQIWSGKKALWVEAKLSCKTGKKSWKISWYIFQARHKNAGIVIMRLKLVLLHPKDILDLALEFCSDAELMIYAKEKCRHFLM